MLKEELFRCQIQEWYPNFKSDSIQTLIHRLPHSFIDYLLQDDVPFVLPTSISGHDPLPRNTGGSLPSDPDYISFFPSSDSDDEDGTFSAPSFPDLELEVQNSIAILGGAVFPKLNWSSPKDAASMGVGASLKCTSFCEIALLLKSSDSIIHDLCHAVDSCSDATNLTPIMQFPFHLALRKWYEVFRPEMEFRCFVFGRKLVGISQREVTTFYPVLVKKRNELSVKIKEFFEEIILPRFGSDDYTFDVYVKDNDRVKLLDFNPWGAYTLSMLFDWEELELERSVVETEFRVVESHCAVRPGLKTAVPFDYLETGEGSGWDEVLKRAIVAEKLQQQQQQQQVS